MPYNANENELAILKFWKENNIFEKSVSGRPENRPYVFYDGPPFATGLPHYGHILSSVIKDVVPRYWTMKGYRVRRRWGWDCHGLPIESLIEKELKLAGKKQIEEMGVDKFNEACRSKVLLYTKEWKKMVDRIGRWVEFDTAYKTMDSTYMESVWWALKKIWDDGRIYEGRKVLLYCPHCETPVSKAEVAMDYSYKDITEEAVTVKFKIKEFDNGKSVYMLAWTTTPWTLPGNVALAVGKDIEYVLVKEQGTENKEQYKEQYIVARERLEQVISGKDYIIIKEMKGADLVGLQYEPLFDMPAMRATGKKAYYVTDADFVTTEEGAGVVHTAVIYGEDDYNLGVKIDLPMVPMLNEKGEFNAVAPGFLRGKYFKQGEKEIKNDLEKRGRLFSRSQHTHSYPHCWRCETQLIYNAISAWFIDIQKVKNRLLKLNEKINWYPEHLKHGRFQNILETAPDWNISRNRFWATPLPFWRCVGKEQGTRNKEQKKCENNVVCIGSVKELKKKAINFDEVFTTDNIEEMDLHKHIVDKIKLKCHECGSEMERIPEVIDCWVESGSMPFAELHYPFENKPLFKKRFPGQYIAEYIAQTRAWFYYMHVMAMLLFDDISFENCVTTGTILNERGEKLSKSKQNYTDPWIIIEQYGVDALRYYLMTSVVMQADDLLFNDREVRDVYNKVVNTLSNVLEFYGMYAGQNQKSKIKNQKSANVLDKWILAKLQALVKEVTESMDNYDTVRAGRPIGEFIAELSQWYVRRSRERFKHVSRIMYHVSDEDKRDGEQAVATLGHVLLTVSKIIAPFAPFIAERVYGEIKKLGNKETSFEESVHLESWPKVEKKMIDDTVINDMEVVRKIVEMGLALRAEAGVRVRQTLLELRINNLELSDELRTIIADELNVKNVNVGEMRGENWKTKEEGKLIVALNVEITPELQKEGLAREIVRTINDMRKKQGLTIENKIEIEYETSDPLLREVFDEYREEIKKGVLASEVREGRGVEMVSVVGLRLSLAISKQ